ncbi:hypothetical protein EJ08DRAFT_645999 [Tothia fuscella]|uniref:Uncharacterized protein n=1 Tax=Tothia fuscella TaxID=1048955 RepID=A0A9P4U2P4_9PEZI|nr:hypothetical protein EJ08DRAFT_645999 [Tothia fuscella]
MDNPSAPPPTPASPTGKYPPTESLSFANPYASLQPSRERQQAPDKRPEKTTGPAARMIAGALGVRAPKRTEEEREYDKAVREQEKRRKEKLKMEEAAKAGEAKKAKQSYWDD